MRLGAVVIGRNEGERLVRCLQSMASLRCPAVYVDSSSTDGSVAAARQLGANAVTLPADRPFTAGRARNFGFEVLTSAHPELEFVLFVDGDCEVDAQWPSRAVSHLQANPEAAIVCGRRRERHPGASIYNAACDMEWDTPVGVSGSCGGDFVARSAVFRQVGGFNPDLIAGEEPEMCFRIRAAGLEIHRIDAPMTLHDAAISRLGQWARRSMRSGYAYAARAFLHRHSGTRYCWRENARIALWAAAVPAAIAAGAWLFGPWALSALAVYPLQYARLLRYARRQHPDGPAAAYALLLMLGNWTEFAGQCRFALNVITGRAQRIIEYK